MKKEEIILQIETSLNEYKGINEAIDDAAFYIEKEFEKQNNEQLIKYNSLLFQYSYFLKDVLCCYEITNELFFKIQNKINELEKLKANEKTNK